MKTTQEQPKTTEELYKKIWIKSEADLPKVDGIYIANSKIFDKIGFWELRNHENDNYPDYCKNQWLHNIDWYLQPIQQIDSIPDLDCGIYEEKTVSPYEGRTTLRPDSPLNIKPLELTDEEIGKQCVEVRKIFGFDESVGCRMGIEWYRDQIKVSVMNELVKFLKWFRGHEDLNELVVEDYLKPKNQ
jgi:hypothetical protein